MKEIVEQSQQSIEIQNALEADQELTNEHIHQNTQTGKDKAEPPAELPKQGSSSESKEGTSTPKESFEPALKKLSFYSLLKFLILLVLFIGFCLLGIWLYANKAIIFKASEDTPKKILISSVDESNKQEPIITNPYVTKQDLRVFSSGIRKDFKEALVEYSRGLDKIDAMEADMSRLRSQYNELKTLILQEGSNSSNNSDERYNQLLSKLSMLESAIESSNFNKTSIEALQAINKDRKILEVHLKNNDWDLRKRMELVEANSGIGSKPPIPVNKPKRQRIYSASMAPPKINSSIETMRKIPREPIEVGTSKSVVWKNQHRWKLRMISGAVTQIQNIDTLEKMLISEGVHVTGCGLVLAIDVPERKVTSQYCTISTKG